MDFLKGDSLRSGEFTLPSVKDLLNAVDTSRGPQQAPAEPLCQGCLSKDRKFPITDGKLCSHCAADRQSVTQIPVSPRISFAYDQVHYQTDASYVSRRSSLADLSYSAEYHHALKPERDSHSPPYVFRAPFTNHDLLPSNMATPRHNSHPSYVPARPRLNSKLTPAKIASNDRHKLSEKHRRDGHGAFIFAGDILRKGLDPGIITHCSVCLTTAAQEGPHSPNTPPPAYNAIPVSNTSGSGRPKKPKNNMLEEGVMWEFSWILHMVPGEVSSHLEGVRELAAQLAREKEYGLQNDWAKRKKWENDVRSEVLKSALTYMERESERHGVDPWVREEARGKKRKIAEVDGASIPIITLPSSRNSPMIIPVMTPPSSRSSPTFGSMPSREGSEAGDIRARLH